MMGGSIDQRQFFYSFSLEEAVPGRAGCGRGARRGAGGGGLGTEDEG